MGLHNKYYTIQMPFLLLIQQCKQEGLAVASTARDVVEMTPLSDDNVR